MPAPLTIQLSAFQQHRLAAMRDDFARQQAAVQQAATQRIGDTVTAILAGVVDPATLAGWDIEQKDDTIVCTPPAPEPMVGD